jgi:two-component system chemotaxis response regulator CheY
LPRILVVEDSTTMRTFVRGALEAAHATLGRVEVTEAASGFEALRLLPRGPYDLIVTDVNMPDINGLELLSFVRKNQMHRETPVLLISTQSSERDRERGMGLGADAYLTKPFTPELLQEEALRQLSRAKKPVETNG